MAVDKKSDFYTTSKSYTDINGSMRNFDMIDHDIKSKLSTFVKEEGIENKVKEDRLILIDKILNIPPVYCSYIHSDFTVRGEREGIIWNEVMLKDEGLPLNKLIDIYNLSKNKKSLLEQGITL